MDIAKIGAQLLMQKLGGGGSADAVQSVLGRLVGNGDSMDLAGMVSGLQQGGLGDVAKSWLGDGENEQISTDQLSNLFGQDKIREAASELGADEGSLLSGLQEALPRMVDQSSQGGSLLDSVGGIAGLAKKLF